VALITFAEAEAFKPISSADATFAATAITAVDAWLKKEIGYELESATYTERLSGTGTAILKPKRWPITAVTSLTVDETAWTTLLYTNATDSDEKAFLPAHGRWLEARDTTFPEGVGNIVLVYVAGYATVPEDLKMCAVMLTHLILLERNRLGDAAKSMGPSGEQIQSIARNAADYQFVKDTIAHYRVR